MSLEWQEEIDLLKEEVERLYRKYQAEQYLLPENKKREREEKIIAKEKEIKSEKFICGAVNFPLKADFFVKYHYDPSTTIRRKKSAPNP